MNPKSTVGLVVVALALFAYIHAFEHRPGGAAKERTQDGAKLLPSFDPARVTSLEIARSNQVIRVSRSDDAWQLLSPPYPAQSTAISALLNALNTLTRHSEIPAQEIISQAGGLSPFGLDPPWATVQFEEGTNTIQLRVGNKTLLGDRVYVQPVRSSGIFLTDAAFLRHIPLSATQWRNPLLIHQSNLAFDHIAISGGRSLKLERDPTNQLWRLVEPWPMRADLDRVQALIRQLSGARVNEFVTDDPKTDLEPFGLQTPEAELSLAQGSNVVFQVQFGKSPTNDPNLVYARRLSHTNIVLIARDLADVVEKKTYVEFRDRTLLSLNPAVLDQIEVHTEESFVVQRQSDQEWRIVQPFDAQADPQLMQLFFEGLARLEIIRFEKDAVADFAPYGLAKPQRQYLFKTPPVLGGTNPPQLLLQADFGASPTNEMGKLELDKIFCRRSDENSVYVVNRGDVLNLPGAAFVLRDRHVWRFAGTNVVGLTIAQGGETLHLTRDSATGAWDKNDQIRNAALEEILFRVGQLQADFWSARGEEAAKQFGAAPSKYQITFEVKEAGKTRPYTLAFGKLAPSGQRYAAVALEQGQPVIFKFPVQLYIGIARYLSIPSADGNL